MNNLPDGAVSGDLDVVGGSYLTPTGEIVVGDVEIRGGVLRRVGNDGAATTLPSGGERLAAAGLVVVPGFIDLQVNGINGIDLCGEPERIAEVARVLPRFGVTAFLPTVITAPPDVVARARAVMCAAMVAPRPRGTARPLGLHLEGPMLAPTRKGAHRAEFLREPSLAIIDGWTLAGGVALVTLAPELDGADEVIKRLVAGGVTVFAGHTDATTDQMREAVALGVRGVTHLFNAMPGLGHREPGPVGVALADATVFAGLIVDGVHVEPTVVALAYGLLGADRLALVSDAVAATAMPPGRYVLGGAALITDEASIRLPDGTLAGSVLTLDRAVRNLVAFTGCPLASALRCATATPAAAIGRADVGILRCGAFGDLAVLDQNAHVRFTVVSGEVVHRG